MSIVKTRDLKRMKSIRADQRHVNQRRWKLLKVMLGLGGAQFDFSEADPRAFAILMRFPNLRNLCYLKRRMETASDKWLWEFLTLGGFEGRTRF